MLIRRLLLSAAVAGAALVTVPATSASACVKPLCDGYVTCHVNENWSVQDPHIVVCYF
jgi:hypothetical protein